MGAVRLRIEVGGHTGINWQVDIFDEGYASTVNSVTGKDLVIKWDREGDDILERIKGSEATIDCYNEDAAFDSFLTELSTAYETQFKMVIYKDSTLFWAGVVVNDVTEYENMSKPRLFQIRAIDGLARLKDVEFDDVLSGAYSDQNTHLKYIRDVLAKNELEQFWGASEAYIRESIEWYDTQMASGTPSASDSPLILARSHKRVFLEHNENSTDDSDLIPKSCYEVVDGILKLYAARIVHVNGAYYIQQARNFDGGTYTERVVYKGSSPSVASSASVSHDQSEGSDIRYIGGASYSYFPPLLKARVKTFPHEWILSEKLNLLVDGGTTTDTETLNIGTIRGGVGSLRQLNVTVNLKHFGTEDAYLHQNLRLKTDIQVKCGSYRIKGQAGLSAPEWTTTAADTYIQYTDVPNIPNAWSGVPFAVAFTTPEIPFASETGCTVVVTLTLQRKNTSISYPSAAKFGYKTTGSRIVALEDGAPFRVTEYQVDNPETNADKNSIVFDLGDLLFTDTGQVSSVNAIEVNSTGSTWVESNVWDAGFDTDVSLAQSVCLEAMALQRVPVDIYRGTFTGKLDGTHTAPMPHKTVDYDSTTWVFNGGEYSAKMDEFRGEWFNLTGTFTGISSGVTKQDKRPWTDQLEGPGEFLPPAVDDRRDEKCLAKLSQNYATTSATTTLSIFAPGHANIENGDTIYVLDPRTGNTLESFAVTADVGASDTSISVTSNTPTYYLPVGACIVHDPNDFISVTDGRATNDFGVGNNLDVVNDATIGNDLSVTGDGTFANIGVAGRATMQDALFDGTATVPAASTDSGTTGQFIADGNYLYLYNGSAWLRVNLSTGVFGW